MSVLQGWRTHSIKAKIEKAILSERYTDREGKQNLCGLLQQAREGGPELERFVRAGGAICV